MKIGRVAIAGTPSFAEFLMWSAARRPGSHPDISSGVARIIADIFDRGEDAALEEARVAGSPNLGSLYASDEEIRKAEVPSDRFAAIRLAIDRIQRFHEKQVEALTKGMTRASVGWQWRMPASGSPSPNTGFLGQRILPYRRVGACVAANSAGPVVSCAVPAKVAGVEECIVTVRPLPDGSISPAVLVAAREVGARTIVKLGGAAGVALMAAGSSRFQPVERVVGSDGPETMEAVRQIWGGGGFAGSCVLIDDSSSPQAAARELLSRAAVVRGGPTFLVATSQTRAGTVHVEIEKRLAEFSDDAERAGFSEVLEKLWTILLAEELEACDVVDRLGPASLTILTKDPDRTALRIRNVANVALGEASAWDVLDPAAGPSPGLSVVDFWRVQNVARLSQSDAKFLEPVAKAIDG
jgi:histidinol dehydrogenase